MARVTIIIEDVDGDVTVEVVPDPTFNFEGDNLTPAQELTATLLKTLEEDGNVFAIGNDGSEYIC